MNSKTLSQAQLCLLETFANMQSQEEADELSRIIRDYYARKLENELDNLWQSGALNQQKLDDLRSQHLRAPYNYEK